jgi:hypothetical protein
MVRNLLDKLSGLPYASLVWVVPVVFSLHELEEWNAHAWEQAHFVEMPYIPLVGSRMFFFAAGVFSFLLVWIVTRFKSPKIIASLTLPFIVLITVNGVQHIFYTLYFQSVYPGFIFGGLLGVPVGVYLVVRALKDRLVHPLYALPFAGLAAFALAHTVLHPTRMSPVITNLVPLTLWLDRLMRF